MSRKKKHHGTQGGPIHTHKPMKGHKDRHASAEYHAANAEHGMDHGHHPGHDAGLTSGGGGGGTGRAGAEPGGEGMEDNESCD